MRIDYNPEMTKVFSERILRDHYERTTLGREGWHRSDAISCPLQAYWRITGEVKGSFRVRDVGIFLVGEMGHVLLERGFDYQEKIVDFYGIKVTVDAIHGKYPVEIKTTRMNICRKENLPREWVEQLSIAISVMGAPKGYLMVLNIVTLQFRVWEFKYFTEKERELFRKVFLNQILAIADAVDKRNPKLLKPKYKDCKFCYYRPYETNKGCPFFMD